MSCHVEVSCKELKEMREAKGISQKELAEITGLSVRTIYRYEAGDTQPDRGKMNLLLQALGEDNRKDRFGNVKRFCPYRTKVTESGGSLFTYCVAELCMGYVDGRCSITISNIQKEREEKNWFDEQTTTETGSA